MKREERALRKAIWESFEGCTCVMSIPPEDRCEKNVIRCQGRANSWRDRLAKAGLVFPVPKPKARAALGEP